MPGTYAARPYGRGQFSSSLYSVGSTRNGASEEAPTILILATIYTSQQHAGSPGMRAYKYECTSVGSDESKSPNVLQRPPVLEYGH
jgi:hypothetical protein